MSPIKGMDKGYSKCHFFEFADGEVSIRNIITDPDVRHVHEYVPSGMVRIVKDSILRKIMGQDSLQNCTFGSMTLNRHPVSTFPATKIASLSGKYFSIPTEYLYYYPPVAGQDKIVEGAAARANLRALEATGVINRKRAGRPPAAEKVIIKIKTLSFFYLSNNFLMLNIT